MLEKLRNKLKLAANFPSPPAVAQQIIELASERLAPRLEPVLDEHDALGPVVERIGHDLVRVEGGVRSVDGDDHDVEPTRDGRRRRRVDDREVHTS